LPKNGKNEKKLWLKEGGTSSATNGFDQNRAKKLVGA